MTRGNLFAQGGNTYLGYAQTALPDEDLWDLLLTLNGKTEDEYREAVLRYLEENYPDEYKQGPVGNADYEFAFFPTQPPASGEFRDWQNWTGIVLVRRIDVDLKDTLGQCYINPYTSWRDLQSVRDEYIASQKQEEASQAADAFIESVKADPQFEALLERCSTGMDRPLPPDCRARILRLYANPTAETWDHAFCINIAPGMTTLWQAVIAIDPSFPRSSGSTRASAEKRWPQVPTREQIVAAIKHATGMV